MEGNAGPFGDRLERGLGGARIFHGIIDRLDFLARLVELQPLGELLLHCVEGLLVFGCHLGDLDESDGEVAFDRFAHRPLRQAERLVRHLGIEEIGLGLVGQRRIGLAEPPLLGDGEEILPRRNPLLGLFRIVEGGKGDLQDGAQRRGGIVALELLVARLDLLLGQRQLGGDVGGFRLHYRD